MPQLGKYLVYKQLALCSIPSTHTKSQACDPSTREGGSFLAQAHPTQPSPGQSETKKW